MWLQSHLLIQEASARDLSWLHFDGDFPDVENNREIKQSEYSG